MPDPDLQPAPDEIELSIFGPGFGECLLMHLGDADWMMVDSCIDQRHGQQPALTYLREMGVDPARAIKLVVATHWHDDHIRGLSGVVAACEQARFVCPAAFREPELIELVGLLGQRPLQAHSGATEIGEVFATLLERRGRPAAGTTPAIVLALPNRELFSAPRSAAGHARVVALSPSDAAVMKTMVSVSGPTGGPPGRPVAAAPTQNHCAIALHVDLPGGCLLLGADLEESGDPAMGWTAVLDMDPRPMTRAQVFKVPHHGSTNGHHDRVWQEMLVPPVYAGLTPYVRGRSPLPTPADIERICALTNHAYITSDRTQPQSPRRDRAVEREMRLVARKISQAEPPLGHVRFRRAGSAPPGEWVVRLFGPAKALRAVA